MKCPLLLMAGIAHEGETGWPIQECLEGECAWWLDDIRMCAIRDIALETRWLQNHLQDLASKVGGAK
jgi:hypothetical protein